MTVTYGFYNSVNNDRKYDAKQMSSLFEGIIQDGVFSSIGDKLMVTSNAGMNVSVGTGRAWFKNTWTNNDTALILTADPPHATLPRIDTVVLEVDRSEAVRANTIKIITGVAGTVPVPQPLAHTPEKDQYPLALLSITPSVTGGTIAQNQITNKVGTSECPFIIGVLSTVTTDTLIANWESEFDIWFNAMKDQLTTDAAGNLQTQINTMKNAAVPGTLQNQITNIQITPAHLQGLVSARVGITGWADWMKFGDDVILPANSKLQCGASKIVWSGSSSQGTKRVTFPVPLASGPLVFTRIHGSGPDLKRRLWDDIIDPTSAYFDYTIGLDYIPAAGSETWFIWLALGSV